jgi:hypothetical protein
VVEVSGENDVFVFQNGITAGELSDQIGRFHLGNFNVRFRRDRLGQREVWQRLALFAQGGDLFESPEAH